jgi:hypothetical protein
MKRNTLILLLIAAVLGGGVYYYESKYGTERDAEPDRSVPAFAFRPDDVTAVTLTNAGKTVAAEKVNGKWTLTQPFVTEADQNGFNQMAEDFARMKLQDRKPGTPENLKEFGLTDPKTTVEIKMKSGETHRVRFGEKDYTGSNVYVLVDQMPEVGLAAVPMLLTAQKPFNDWREKKILKLTADDVTKFRVRNPNVTLAAEKSSDGKWLVKEPAEKKDKEVVEYKALTPWLNIIAQEIIDQPSDEIKAKLAKPAVEIQVTGKDGQTTNLKVSAADDDKAYVSVEGRAPVYRIRKDELESMSFKLPDVINEPTPTPSPSVSPVASPSVSPKAAKKK